MKTKKMKTKKWYTSKTVWTVLFTLLVTILQSQGVELPEWVIPSLLSAGLVFSRAGEKTLK